ncbi:unnamed protein product [Scytosiphon promiscuus]
MVSTKAEAEALTVEELTTELTSRGIPTEGLKQPAMLETLLKHLDTAASATTNGSAEAPAAEKTAEEPKKDDAAAPAEEVRGSQLGQPACSWIMRLHCCVTCDASDDGLMTASYEVQVSGGTEEPDAKKAKADAPAETAEPAKVVETPTEAPASEPAAAAVAE